jgi:hypothetical protein
MKTRYLVINAAASIMQGSVELDGEQVVFQRSVQRVELAPENSKDYGGTILLVAHGREDTDETRKWAQGDVIEIEFRKV